MTGYDNRGARFPLTIVRGADLAFELTVTDANAAAVNLSAATIAGEIYTTAGTLVDTLTAAVSGAGSNIVTLSLTDTETALLTATKMTWTLWVTRGGDKRPWLAGDVYMGDGTTGQSGTTSGSQALTVDGDLSVSVNVLAIGASASGTDLTWTAATSVVASSSGTDATLTVADGSNPGLMSSAHYTKLNTIDADITTLSLPANTTISAFGATLVDDADQSTARTTLGLGTGATATIADYLPKVAAGASVENVGAVESNVQTVATTGATETLDTATYGVFDMTMDQACEFTFSNPAPSGKNTTFVLILRGAFTPTLPASVDWGDASAPTYTTPSVYVFTTVDAGTTWLGSQVGKAFA